MKKTMLFIRKYGLVYLMILPAIIIYSIFVIYPMFKGLFVSFHRWDGLSEMKWIGLNNYRFVFKDQIFWNAMKNTLLFAFVVSIAKNVAAFFLAILLNRNIKLRTFFRTATFLPVTLAFVVAGMLWSWMYNPIFGLINNFLKLVHLEIFIQGWLSDPKIALWSIMFVDIWKWVGFHMVLFLTGIQAIPEELYEAARIDGAGRWQSLFHITVPLVMQVTIVSFLLSITGAFVSNYDLVYVMTGGGPFHSTEVALTWIVSTTTRYAAVGKGNAMSMIMFLIVLVFGVFQMYFSQRNTYEM
jgi:ABC-type sugar transport system permease subunit